MNEIYHPRLSIQSKTVGTPGIMTHSSTAAGEGIWDEISGQQPTSLQRLGMTLSVAGGITLTSVPPGDYSHELWTAARWNPMLA